MLDSAIKRWIYWGAGAYVALCAVALFFEFYFILALPVALVIAWLLMFRLDLVFMVVTFATPLSMNLEDLELGGFGVYLPTEPLLAAMLLLLTLKGLRERAVTAKVLRHPVTIAIIINLVWILVTSFTSEVPSVSFKFLISRLWFVIPCYFFAIEVFKNPEKIKWFLWLYIIPLAGVIIYAVINHQIFAFDEKAAHWVMSPFFKDHTSYGAILAMFFPAVVGLWLGRKYKLQYKWAIFGLLAIFVIGIVLSYTRAAWVSLLGALAVFAVLHFRIKLRVIMFGVLTVLVGFFIFQNQIIRALEKNKQDSSEDLVEHVQSISNITSDASNLERLNRWNAAFEMFKERPMMGWGPGVYMFEYAPFQHSSDLTIISTNFGNRGNAHSELIGPLSESGVLGMLTIMAIMIAGAWTAVRVYKRYRGRRELFFVLPVFLGLITYYLHGLLNNYLDTDKASVPFWGFLAILVAADIYGDRFLKKPTV